MSQKKLSGETRTITKTTQKATKNGIDPIEAANCAFAGTTIVQGNGKGIIVAIGKQTYFGEIAVALNPRRRSNCCKIL